MKSEIPVDANMSIAEECSAGISTDTNAEVIFRAAQAFCRTDREWRSRVESVLRSGIVADFQWFEAAVKLFNEFPQSSPEPGPSSELATKRQKLSVELYKKLSYPVAVFPQRSNARLVAQAGMFTLHGGKGPDSRCTGGTLMSAPLPMEELAKERQEDTSSPNYGNWLLRYDIPSGSKELIEEQLMAIGINRTTLYPEVQSDAETLKELWSQNSKRTAM
jgi:hypothetical protein